MELPWALWPPNPSGCRNATCRAPFSLALGGQEQDFHRMRKRGSRAKMGRSKQQTSDHPVRYPWCPMQNLILITVRDRIPKEMKCWLGGSHLPLFNGSQTFKSQTQTQMLTLSSLILLTTSNRDTFRIFTAPGEVVIVTGLLRGRREAGTRHLHQIAPACWPKAHRRTTADS